MKSIKQVNKLLIYTRIRKETVIFVSPCAVYRTPGPTFFNYHIRAIRKK